MADGVQIKNGLIAIT